ncbi:MAG: DUF3500 domain-containing protein [Verrucomicrobia bacterium]|nr:MAG: DUF3500 domain-containing protein [Verrucomicrobiota bacterium]
MTTAVQRFLAALDPHQQALARFPMDARERLDWHYVPRERRGLSLKAMSPAQQHLAHALLATALSHRGYLQAATIMGLEEVLREIEQGRGPARDPELYFVSIFGKPGGKAPWGWRFEGHHLSLNFTVAPDIGLRATPSMFGSNPAEVRRGPRRGLRALALEEDLARQLLASLSPEQRRRAIVSDRAPRDIILTPARAAGPLPPFGLAAVDMTPEQQVLLERLIRLYLDRYRPGIADEAFRRIEAVGLARVHFAWAGGAQPGEGHYYRIQGPTFILEFDNTQNDANHIHTVWRDFEGDFGADLLRRHYQSGDHPH